VENFFTNHLIGATGCLLLWIICPHLQQNKWPAGPIGSSRQRQNRTVWYDKYLSLSIFLALPIAFGTRIASFSPVFLRFVGIVTLITHWTEAAILSTNFMKNPHTRLDEQENSREERAWSMVSCQIACRDNTSDAFSSCFKSRTAIYELPREKSIGYATFHGQKNGAIARPP